jgi:hypothetical protein
MEIKTAEEILNFIGIDKVEDLDTFKVEFNSRFVPLNDAHNNPDIQQRVVGKRMTEITSKLADFGKSVGLDVTFDQLAKKKVEEVITDFKGSLSERLQELSNAANSGTDKRVHDLAKQLEEKDKSLNQFKEEWEKTANEFNAYKEQAASNIKSYKVNHQLDSLKSKIAWVDDINDIHREGFESYINKNYVFDLDENERLIVKDREGKFIPKKDKAGSFADPFEILSSVAEQNRLVKKNNADNNKKNVIFADRKSDKTDEDKSRFLSKAYLNAVKR